MKAAGTYAMPTYEFECEVCGISGRAWRPEGHHPRFCGTAHQARGLAGISRKPVKYRITAEIHEHIRRVYLRDTGNGQVRALAKAIGLPRWKITRYAIEQGWTAKQKKEPDWSEAEIKVLAVNAYLGIHSIQRKLLARGFRRSAFGIQLKRKRLRLPGNLDGQSANGLAGCLGVDIHFVLRAIANRKLRAIRRGTERTKAQGGDIWFIKDRWARSYILENLEAIDIRKVDKYWLVDLLTARRAL